MEARDSNFFKKTINDSKNNDLELNLKPELMKTKLVFFLFLCSFTAMYSQQLQITGTVISSEDNLPIVGANVLIVGKSAGTTTDFDGNYQLSVNPGDQIAYSYLGFETKTITITDQQKINVNLEVDTATLDEVVVVGYGTKKVTTISGAISTVDSKSIEKLNATRPEDALQGQASGVNVIASGTPGGKPTVFIRGIASNGGNDPLVLIDGVPQTLDDLNALNPADIKQMDVLKDAATTAIYGVKGGNGVIVVTTKSGRKNQKASYSYSSSYGVQEAIQTIDLLNASQYGAILNEASVASGGDLIFTDLSSLGEGTDWQDEILASRPIVTHNLSVTGGSEKSTYFVSIGHTAQDGIIKASDKLFFNRFNLTGNFTTDFTDKFKLILNTSYSNLKSAGVNPLFNALNFDPVTPVRDSNGDFGVSSTITQEVVNPIAQIDNTYNSNKTDKFFGKFELQYDVLEDFKVTSRFGYTYANVYSKGFDPLKYYGVGHNATNANQDLSPIVSVNAEDGTTTSTHNRVSESFTNYFSYTYEFFGNYKFTLEEDHNFDVVGGMSISRSTAENVTANNEDVPFNSWEFADISSATGNSLAQTSGSWQYVKRNLSYFGRIDYDYQEKYLASFTGRRDGSTSFGANNKFAFFPSGSLGWNISKEDFFNEDAFVNNLKVRGSYGVVGSDNISPQFALISTFPQYVFDGQLNSGSTLQSIPNNSVTWESQKQLNAGFDAKLFDNRLSITADYYEKKVDDLLFSPTLSLYLGTPEYPAANIGKTKSSGFDISVSYNDEISDNFSFGTTVNFTSSKNEVETINNGDKFVWLSGYGIPYKNLTRFEEGFSPGYFYGYKTDGIFQNQAEIDAHATQTDAQPGDIRFADVNKDGEITDADRTKIGDPYADFVLGWNITLDVYDFDFTMFTYASVGGDIYRAYERNLNFTNRFASVLDRWTGEGTSNSEPRVSFVDSNNNTRASDRYVEDGSFVKIKNIQLGYTLPKDLTEKIGFENVRVYAQGKNIYTFTKYSGFDPEISGGVFDTGIDRGSYPIPRVWSLGVNLKF
jgi:TonB-linked SusC/RagA family outer membrane protein